MFRAFVSSQGYGKADHEEAKKLLLTKYANYEIECSDEGYWDECLIPQLRINKLALQNSLSQSNFRCFPLLHSIFLCFPPKLIEVEKNEINFSPLPLIPCKWFRCYLLLLQLEEFMISIYWFSTSLVVFLSQTLIIASQTYLIWYRWKQIDKSFWECVVWRWRVLQLEEG
jgi:hypothetical protein